MRYLYDYMVIISSGPQAAARQVARAGGAPSEARHEATVQMCFTSNRTMLHYFIAPHHTFVCCIMHGTWFTIWFYIFQQKLVMELRYIYTYCLITLYHTFACDTLSDMWYCCYVIYWYVYMYTVWYVIQTYVIYWYVMYCLICDTDICDLLICDILPDMWYRHMWYRHMWYCCYLRHGAMLSESRQQTLLSWGYGKISFNLDSWFYDTAVHQIKTINLNC